MEIERIFDLITYAKENYGEDHKVFGFKKDKTTLRRIDENNSQVSAGQNKINFYLTADYQFSTRLSAQAFFKRDSNTPFVSTSFPTSTTFAGLMIRFNLAQ